MNPVNPKRRRLFADFDTCGDPVLIEALNEARLFVNSLKAEPWSCSGWMLSFIGKSGTGKSFLSGEIIPNELGLNDWWTLAKIPRLDDGGRIISPTFYRASCRKLAEGIQSFTVDLTGLAEPFLLVLDDFGAWHDPSGFVTTKFDRLLREREGKWTLLTSNFTLPELGKNDARIPSFMKRDRNRVVTMDTIDFALRKGRGQA